MEHAGIEQLQGVGTRASCNMHGDPHVDQTFGGGAFDIYINGLFTVLAGRWKEQIQVRVQDGLHIAQVVLRVGPDVILGPTRRDQGDGFRHAQRTRPGVGLYALAGWHTRDRVRRTWRSC